LNVCGVHVKVCYMNLNHMTGGNDEST